jgi:hypothetical protein
MKMDLRLADSGEIRTLPQGERQNESARMRSEPRLPSSIIVGSETPILADCLIGKSHALLSSISCAV